MSDVADHLPIFHLSDFYIDVNHTTVKSHMLYVLKIIKFMITAYASYQMLSDVLSNTQWND